MSQERWIEVARTGGAYGVRGWCRVVPLGSGEALVASKRWRFVPRSGEPRLLNIGEIKKRGDSLLVRFSEVTNKEEADAMHGHYAVARDDFPQLEAGEHWLVDLIGCEVVNREGEILGRVSKIDNNGAQDILGVQGQDVFYMIPLVKSYVEKIDTEFKAKEAEIA